MRILLADDSVVIRYRLMSLLSDLPGVEVVGLAATGAEAVARFEHLHPDLTVLDIRMPGGGGIEALSRIKAQDPSAAVIVLTNYPEEQYRRQCLEAGAEFFLDKSTEFERLPEAIEQIRQTQTAEDPDLADSANGA